MARIATDRPPLIVAKPLVESQNVRDILDWAPEARAIWIYRDFRDVAASNPEYFGGDKGHRDLAHILATDDANWRLQNMDPDDVEKIRTVYTPDIGPTMLRRCSGGRATACSSPAPATRTSGWPYAATSIWSTTPAW